MDEKERIQACFCSFIEGSLITHDFEHPFLLQRTK